ncbi:MULTISPECIES: hypothetical protein [unclassified Janthinobacterium]|uniref:hypothetical protein n=1 Tax=unclassified Janthinobacterium TaxID=2610881 RepID=UPI0025B3113C|nr:MULTISPECIES: hypothetical protein [unclassified Janthinobacterium]MDN2678163.1 hypothetical protein [Janthinobacterium sp. SUN033]MDN2715070.1 hypothetical protein [Janthinobacterium sp. SUN120]MDO8050354.1 hypothetical protein [Janthinobacterium sp. SUN211]MDO8070320.1 hypothetical protein [Janthinobacterium sp. SUN176]MED5616044.1 hypothetical protein [Janthinobacterium sp. P210005]
MLTATYILVSLSVEQASIRMSLLAFQKYMQVQLRQQSRLSLAQLQYTGDWLNRLYQGSYWRKVEMYLIPAIRQAAPHVDGLLDELNGLNHAALESINVVQQRAGAAIDHSELQAEQLCAAIDAFCAALLQRLEKEERELFALARKVIVGEAWFAIAYQFLAHDARAQEARRGKAQVLPFVLPAPLPAPLPAAGGAETLADGAASAPPAPAQPLRAQA